MGQIYNDRQHDEVTRSCGEVNDLIGCLSLRLCQPSTLRMVIGEAIRTVSHSWRQQVIDIVRALRAPNNVSNLLRFRAEGRTIAFSSKRKKTFSFQTGT
ncbi:MAG: hypothetical protein M3178_02300 [Pseudomonadota bacterium]|nr:hypothetical protein [Pseudomonadota bacterium]